MKPIQPVPLKIGDHVRIGVSGRTIWSVHCGPDNGTWHLVSARGADRYTAHDQMHRVTGAPIAALSNERSSSEPRPVAMRDKVLFTGAKARTVWTVIEIDDRELRIVSHHTYRYVTWQNVSKGRLVHANGAPIAVPKGVR